MTGPPARIAVRSREKPKRIYFSTTQGVRCGRCCYAGGVVVLGLAPGSRRCENPEQKEHSEAGGYADGGGDPNG